MAAPLGNQNAAKGRRMARIFEGICAEEEYKRITAGINKQLDAFAAGDLKAGEFVRDTTDGKPAQQLHLAGGLDLTTRAVEMSDDELAAIAKRASDAAKT